MTKKINNVEMPNITKNPLKMDKNNNNFAQNLITKKKKKSVLEAATMKIPHRKITISTMR